MARKSVWRIILGLAASSFLVACVETSETSDTGGAAGTPGTSERLRPGTEVEAPDVFQANESALWDGRPSLGGIWVASPDAVDPERVVMFNPATGKTVKGALFRRERENPGPRLQLSSDAAEALGVLAGMPTELQVTALRKLEAVEEVADPAAVEPMDAAPADATTPEDGAEPAASAAETEAAAVAAAALEAVDASAASPEGADAVAADAAVDGAVTEVPPKKKTWKEKRAEAKAAREAKKAAAAAAKAAAAGGAVVVEGAEGAEGTVAPTAETAGVTEIESAPLDARKPEVAAGEAPAPEPVKEAAAEEATSAPADAAAPAAGGAQRTIQIATFSKEENANRAVEALSKISIAARVQKSEKDGKAVWGVVATGDEATLKQIKDAGFADAYFLK